MFATRLARPIPRSAFVHTVRCMSKNSAGQNGKHIKNEVEEHHSSGNGQTSSAPSTREPPLTAPLQLVPSLDFSPLESHKERTKARSSKGSLSTSERKRKLMGRISLALLALGFGANMVYMGREWELNELTTKKLKVEDAPSTRWARTKQRFADIFNYFNEPAWPELLPPSAPAPHQKPYTLLLSLDDLLITSTWDRQHGWRTAKRPGVDYFLAYISQFYEVVIFTSQASYTAAPILEKLDRYNFFITHRLFREATRSLNNKIVKDLSYLNRDLSKVIMLDTHPDHACTHPENSIILAKWNGDPKDKGLVSMIPFLESIGIYKPLDVRPILEAYKDKDIPVEYAKREAEAKERHIEMWRSSNKGPSPSTFGRVFGLSTQAPVEKNAPPLTYLEAKRKEAQKQYRDEQIYIKDHREELEKLLAQDQQAMAAEVPANLWEALDQIAGKKKPDASSVTAKSVQEQSSDKPTPSLPL